MKWNINAHFSFSIGFGIYISIGGGYLCVSCNCLTSCLVNKKPAECLPLKSLGHQPKGSR